MENTRFIKITLFITSMAFFMTPFYVHAYKVSVHRDLTQESFSGYEKLFGDIFSDVEIAKAVQGSDGEDDGRRPLRHFYDPLNKKGLFETWIASKDWAQSTDVQSKYGKNTGFNDKYFSNSDDYSWDRAVYEYAHGDKDRAVETLGHILHLIQDTTVPAHVRNDDHLSKFGYGDINLYEEFTVYQSIPEFFLDISDVPDFVNLDDSFNRSSKFTNENFLSKDTVFKNYNLPKEDQLSFIGGFGYNKDFKHKVVFVKEKFVRKTKKIKKEFSIEDKNDLVLTDYWNVLSRQAVLNGVGVIKLFFEEVDRERQTLALKEKNKSQAERMLASIIPTGFNIVKGLYGSSLTNSDVQDLLGENQSGAVVLAVNQEEAPENIEPAQLIPEPEIIKKKEIPQVQNDATPQPTNSKSEESPIPEQVNQPEPKKKDIADFLIPVPISPGYGSGGGGGVAQAKLAPQGNPTDTISPDAPIIITPADFSSVFTTTDILFSGTAEATSIISTNFSQATTSADSAGDWSLALSGFSQGTTTVQFFATDEAGNISPATSTSFFIDSEVPDVSLDVAECAQSLSQSECLLDSTTLSFSWNSPAGDLAYFSLNINGIASTTSATSTSIDATGNNTYSFGVSAIDIYGNTSATSTQVIAIETMPVVINEVAWAGTAASPSDEWIELYNNTNVDISLDNWFVYAEDGSPYIPLSGTIAANDYYLIERSIDNDTISDMVADLAVPFSGTQGSSGLSNSGEHLILARLEGGATTTVDEILKCRNWCGRGATRSYKTMERFDSRVAGTDLNNWGSNIGIIRNGKDANGGYINGTPKAKNSFSYLVNRGNDIGNSVVLKKENSPYVVNRQNFKIWIGGTLNIEPGVVVKFKNDTGIVVEGNIVANGTASEPIVFTSFVDDEYAGDTNGDGLCDSGNASSTATCPTSGMWRTIEVLNTANSSSFDYTVFRYGGFWRNGSTLKRANLYVEGVSPSIMNSIFEYSGRYGLRLSNASSTVSQNIFRNNNYVNNNDRSSCGLYGGMGGPVIDNNVFENNVQGLCFSSSNADITNNEFTGNTYRTFIYTGILGGSISGNSGSSNVYNGIVLYGIIAQENSTTTLKKNNIPYLIHDGELNVNASSTFAIDPGVVLKFKGWRMNVLGYLDINGESGNPVVFTSLYDDSDGNDAGNDGPSDGRVSGEQGVYLKDGSTSDIEHAEFRFMKKALSYDNSPISLSNVSFEGNRYGVYATGASSTVIKADSITFVGDTNTATSTIPLIVP